MSLIIANKGTGQIIKRGISFDDAASILELTVQAVSDQAKNLRFSQSWFYVRNEEDFNPHEVININYPIILFDLWDKTVTAYSSIASCSKETNISRSVVTYNSKHKVLIDKRYLAYRSCRVGKLNDLKFLKIPYKEV